MLIKLASGISYQIVYISKQTGNMVRKIDRNEYQVLDAGLFDLTGHIFETRKLAISAAND